MGKREICLVVLTCVVAVLVLPDVVPYFYSRVSWDHYSDEGRRLILFGDKDKAVEYYKNQVDSTIRNKGLKDPSYIAAREGLALAYERQGMFRSAEDQYNEALNQLQKSWLPDRTRMKETLGLMAAMYEKNGDNASLAQIKQRIAGLNPWWQWFWSCFTLVFMAEALYLANVIARPGDLEISHFKVPFLPVYAFTVLISTVGMLRGLVMEGIPVDSAILLALGITLVALPAVLSATLVFSKQLSPVDARLMLRGPSNERGRRAN